MISFVCALPRFASAVPVEQSTPAFDPIFALSNESNTAQLKLAVEQGEAEARAVSWIAEHADSHGSVRAGDYRLVWTLSPSEGWYALENGALAWHDAPKGSVHLRLFVLDGADGRLVPDLTVRATTQDGAPPTTLAYGWYPLENAYGANVPVPRNGRFHPRFEVGPFPGRRHDPYNGYRFIKDVFAQFASTSVSPSTIASETALSDREAEQHGLAEGERKALDDTVKGMFKQANDGKQKTDGDWQVVMAVEYAESWWFCRPHHALYYTYQWENSAEKNSHWEVAPRDAETGRFLPEVKVEGSVLTDNGNSLGSFPVPFMWHPWLYHFGENWRVPHSGKYTFKVHIEPPTYRRYGRTAGKILAKPVDLEFDGIKVKTGEK